MDPTASVRSLASAASAGELFEYAVGSVSLPRQRSAMIPIVTDPIEAERVSIYNPSVLPRNPLNGARVRNTTGKLLLAGPVTVLDGAAYAGDAQIDDVPAGQERLVSFGVDLQVLVDATDDGDHDQIVTARVAKGILYVTQRTRHGARYVAENKSGRDRVLVIEHPRQSATRGGDWQLIDSPRPAETTDAVYRFRTTVAAGRSVTVRVAEESTGDQQIRVLQDNELADLDRYSRTGEIPPAVRAALAKVVALRGAAADTQHQIDAGKQRLTDIAAEQGRIRENLKSVESTSQYYARLMGKLNDQETAIEKTQAEVDAFQKQLDAQRKELDAHVAGLEA